MRCAEGSVDGNLEVVDRVAVQGSVIPSKDSDTSGTLSHDVTKLLPNKGGLNADVYF
jgi:hypothetical protein